jgi:hypothetical protein
MPKIIFSFFVLLFWSTAAWSQGASTSERDLLALATRIVSQIHQNPVGVDETGKFHTTAFAEVTSQLAALEDPSYAVIQFLVYQLRTAASSNEGVLTILENSFEALVKLGRRQKPGIRFLLREALVTEIKQELGTQLKTRIDIPVQLAVRFLLPHPREYGADEVVKLIVRAIKESPNQERKQIVSDFSETMFQYELGGSEWYDHPSKEMKILLKLQDKYLLLYGLENIENYVVELNRSNDEMKNGEWIRDHILRALQKGDAEVRSRALALTVLILRSGFEETVLNSNHIEACMFATRKHTDVALQKELKALLAQRPVQTAAAPGSHQLYVDSVTEVQKQIELDSNPMSDDLKSRIENLFLNIEMFSEDPNTVAKFLGMVEAAQAKGYDVKNHLDYFRKLQSGAFKVGLEDIVRRTSVIIFPFENGPANTQFCAATMIGTVVVH